MKFNAADILHAYCAFIPKYKYVICLCPVYPYFFLINSKPRRITPDAQIMITKADFPFLKDDSYINTATICTIYKDEINKGSIVGIVPNHIKDEIVKVTNKGRYLSPNIKALITKNLSSP